MDTPGMSRRPPAENWLRWFEPAPPFTKNPNNWPPRLIIARADLCRHAHLQKRLVTNHTPAKNRVSRFEPASPSTRPKITWVDLSQLENYELVVNHGIPATAHPRLKIAWADLNRLSHLQNFPVNKAGLKIGYTELSKRSHLQKVPTTAHGITHFEKFPTTLSPPRENRLSWFHAASPISKNSQQLYHPRMIIARAVFIHKISQ